MTKIFGQKTSAPQNETGPVYAYDYRHNAFEFQSFERYCSIILKSSTDNNYAVVQDWYIYENITEFFEYPINHIALTFSPTMARVFATKLL